MSDESRIGVLVKQNKNLIRACEALSKALVKSKSNESELRDVITEYALKSINDAFKKKQN